MLDLHALDAGQVGVVPDVVDQVRDIEQQPGLHRGGPRPASAGAAGVTRFGERRAASSEPGPGPHQPAIGLAPGLLPQVEQPRRSEPIGHPAERRLPAGAEHSASGSARRSSANRSPAR